MELALRIIDAELRLRGAALYTLEHARLQATGTVKLSPSEFAVTHLMEARTEDTAFSVAVTSDFESHEHTEANCNYAGQWSNGLDIYRSDACVLLKGNFSAEVDGTPAPQFFLSYIKVTILDDSDEAYTS